MRVLMSGHDGYIGSVMAPMFLEAGHQVVGLDTYLFKDCTFGRAAPGVESMSVDMRDVTARHLEGFDAVINLAALSNDPLSDLNPECTYEINPQGSVRLARAAKEAGVARFLHSSSCSL